MVKWSSIALMALCTIHVLVLGADIPSEAGKWLGLNMWTFDHWAPLREQPLDLALSGGVFWATLGSFAVPMFVLGALLFWLDRRELPIPAFVGWALFAWMAVATAPTTVKSGMEARLNSAQPASSSTGQSSA